MDKVSVVVPMYNCEKYIGQCLDSIMAQSYTDLEIIAVDDGSTDSSFELASKKAESDKRLTVIKQKNSGPSAARNAGIDLAAGKYIIFVDSDDYIGCNHIKSLVDAKNQYRDSSMVLTGYTTFGNTGTANMRKNAGVDENTEYEIWDFVKIFALELLNPPVGRLFEAEKLKANKIYFDNKYKIGEDLIFNIDYIEKAMPERICIINANDYMYRQDSQDSLTKLRDANYYSFSKEQYERLWRLADNVGISEADRFILKQNFYFMVLNAIRQNKDNESLTVSERNRNITHILKDSDFKAAVRRGYLDGYVKRYMKIFYMHTYNYSVISLFENILDYLNQLRKRKKE